MAGPQLGQPQRGLTLGRGTCAALCSLLSLHGRILTPLLPPQSPFPVTLRFWDIYILEGEPVLTAMSYMALKIHKSESPGAMEGGVLGWGVGDPAQPLEHGLRESRSGCLGPVLEPGVSVPQECPRKALPLGWVDRVPHM